jgi:hypothetical protein
VSLARDRVAGPGPESPANPHRLTEIHSASLGQLLFSTSDESLVLNIQEFGLDDAAPHGHLVVPGVDFCHELYWSSVNRGASPAS